MSRNHSKASRRIEVAERTGWKLPATDEESPHPVWVDYDRHRVICRGCPWFWGRLGATRAELKLMGQRHRRNMREVADR